MVTSKSLFKSVERVFRWSSENELEMHVQLSRLCVLYEDLKIEFAGAEAETLGSLDRTDATTRRFYFVRRILATLTEIEQAIAKLNGNKDFQTAKNGFKPENLKSWDDAVGFFAKEHAFLKNWRNDLGGHFHDSAAKYAIENIHPDTLGVIEIYRRGNDVDAKLKFAYELVAVAMTKNKQATQPEKEFLEQTFTFLKEAATHALNAGQVVIAEYIVPRFRA